MHSRTYIYLYIYIDYIVYIHSRTYDVIRSANYLTSWLGDRNGIPWPDPEHGMAMGRSYDALN